MTYDETYWSGVRRDYRKLCNIMRISDRTRSASTLESEKGKQIATASYTNYAKTIAINIACEA